MLNIGNRLFGFHGRKTYWATRCKHLSAEKGWIRAFSCDTITEMATTGEDTVDWCLSCIEKMAIPCAWCGGAVFIGDPVTLYTPAPNGRVIERAVWFNPQHESAPSAVIGCLRMSCADSGADVMGFWMPQKDGAGAVQRIRSVYERIISSDAEAAIIDHSTREVRLIGRL